jgi:hypothetical protein
VIGDFLNVEQRVDLRGFSAGNDTRRQPDVNRRLVLVQRIVQIVIIELFAPFLRRRVHRVSDSVQQVAFMHLAHLFSGELFVTRTSYRSRNIVGDSAQHELLLVFVIDFCVNWISLQSADIGSMHIDLAVRVVPRALRSDCVAIRAVNRVVMTHSVV